MKEQFNRMIEEADSVCVLGHINPDGDCLGSTLGVRAYIRNRYPGKRVNVYLMEANRKFAYLPGFDSIVHIPSDRKYDLAILCDCATLDRLGDFGILARNAKQTFIADHHITNSNAASGTAQILPHASSTCEVVFDLMEQENIDQDCAVCLYTGIIHDTGVFKYSATSPHTMEIAGFLMGKGIDFGHIIDDSFYFRTYAQQQVQGRVLLESMLLMDRRVLVSWLTMKEMRFYNVSSKDIDGIVATMRETRGVDAAVFLYEIANQVYKVSLRSNNPGVDVSAIAAHFGGGGHRMAAGCSLAGSAHDVINNITRELSIQMDAADFVSNAAREQE